MTLLKKLFGIAFLSLIVFSCSKENENLESSLTVVKSQSGPITCDIVGSVIVVPGSNYTYNYPNNFNANSITWSTSGTGMTIISGQNTGTITIQFSSQFSGGTVLVSGTNGNLGCNDTLSISTCTPPSSVDIEQDETSNDCPGSIIVFDALLSGGSTSAGTYQWSVFQGATIVSGQGTSQVRVRAPSSSGFAIAVTHTSQCGNQSTSNMTLGLYDSECGGGGGPTLGF